MGLKKTIVLLLPFTSARKSSTNARVRTCGLWGRTVSAPDVRLGTKSKCPSNSKGQALGNPIHSEFVNDTRNRASRRRRLNGFRGSAQSKRHSEFGARPCGFNPRNGLY